MARLAIPVFLLSLVATTVWAFEIKSFEPQSGSAMVKEGEDLELLCTTDNYWEWCKITHVPSGKS